MDINSAVFLLTHPFGTLSFEDSLTVVQLRRSQPDVSIENFRIDRHEKQYAANGYRLGFFFAVNKVCSYKVGF